MGLAAIQVSVNLESHTCGTCGIPFAAPDYFWAQRKRDGQGYSCPNGHSWVYTETEAQKLEKQLDTEKQRVEFFKRQTESERSQHVATKGLLTKAKKALARVENGVCPKCNRTFKQLAKHMQSKHGIECNQPPEGSKVRLGVRV